MSVYPILHRDNTIDNTKYLVDGTKSVPILNGDYIDFIKFEVVMQSYGEKLLWRHFNGRCARLGEEIPFEKMNNCDGQFYYDSIGNYMPPQSSEKSYFINFIFHNVNEGLYSYKDYKSLTENVAQGNYHFHGSVELSCNENSTIFFVKNLRLTEWSRLYGILKNTMRIIFDICYV